LDFPTIAGLAVCTEIIKGIGTSSRRVGATNYKLNHGELEII